MHLIWFFLELCEGTVVGTYTQNFKLKFPGILLRKEFWAACGNQVELNNHMAEINSISPAAHRWLLQILVTCWAKHCFPNKPSAHMSQTI